LNIKITARKIKIKNHLSPLYRCRKTCIILFEKADNWDV